ncbi:retinitis pigmentosa 1-like 1 protein isoform X2 [Sphaeramia orbicularis]|uniref:retinitis pigmentosa 1-like 1 protein isoform X2 n=1 Tax=Sphaeramia orbicularis TaxID=375764 RepID=UPI00117E0A22|nr:retinitis pigmentosa 1-like 1 protein isoform X2 [Sphaeramia orbicularis]
MHSVQEGVWDPQPPSKHASPHPPPYSSNSRLTHVTRAAPAKRITFYKSGDSQFGGVRMAIHKRSFKCFDALLDDLSQKVPLPFGVRTVTTPRGTHTIKQLEQLQDGGCYLCSDRRQAKPINMDLATKRPSIWYYHSRRPQRPDASSATPPGYLSHRHRRILLVKNGEPSIRKSIVLSRRSTRSLRAFLEEASEVMQFHVRKLYTVEGRKIDSVQSLMTCPGVLVCVGREAFSPVLVNFIRKSSEEKLPGLSSKSPGLGPRTPGNGARSPATQGTRSPPHGAQSRASEYSEGHESKKNVNFGLETKKSIIHPRSDSSNRSARFSLSSEKSYGNGISALSQAKTAIMNDDIEKRVLVNKDGSLSLEMRVRFHLQNDETLQWSTQIKKSPPLPNDCCPLSQDHPHFLQQGQSESCSDPDSASFDPEGVGFSSQTLQCALEGNHCPCCYQRQVQQYDLWENPAHSHKQPVPPPHGSSQTHTIMRHSHSSSSSSSCNSRRVVRCRAKLTNCGEVSGSEQSQLVQEEMCVTEQVEHRVEVEQDGDTHIEVCKVSRCCSRSEVITVDNTSRPQSGKSCEDEVMGEEEEGRPMSAVSSSSRILQTLKEDQDDEEDDLPPSASQCCQRNEPSPTPTSQSHVNDKPTSNVSAGSIHSTEHNKLDIKSESRAESACQGGAATPRSTAGAGTMNRASSAQSKISRASHKSTKADDETEDVKRVVSGLSGRSGISAGTSVCPNCGGCKRVVSRNSNSRASQRSHHSSRLLPKPGATLLNQENTKEGSDNDGSDASDQSTQSNKSNVTNHGRISAISNGIEGRASSARSTPEPVGQEEERTPSAASAKSHRSSRSHKSGCKGTTCVTAENVDNRSQSAMSAQSNLSTKTKKSNYSATANTPDIKKREEADGENVLERAVSSLSVKSGASVKSHKSNNSAGVEEDETNGSASAKEERPASALSAKSVKSTKSEVSAQSKTSHKSSCSNCARAASPGIEAAAEIVVGKEEGPEAQDRTASAMSVKSNISAQSNKSLKSNKAAERTLSPRSDTRGDAEDRAASQMSAKSVKSIKSTKSNCNGNTEASSDMGDNSEEAHIRAGSALSVQSNQTKKSSRVASPAKGKSDRSRTSSAMSGTSHTSAKSTKPQKTNHTPAATSISTEAGEPSVEVNGNEEENNERVASAMSVTSKSSNKSTNVVTIKTLNGGDEGNETTERPQSAVSAKSEKSISSASNLNGTTEAAENVVEDNVPKSRASNQTLSPRRARSPKSPGPPGSSQSQQLSPGTGETRGSSVLSVHSTASAKSAKSSRSKCHCGAGSGLDKVKKESMEEAVSERAASIHSSSSKRQRRESGGTEQPLSRNSSGSVSLGLPADPETAESDSESCANADESKSKTVTPDVNKSTEEVINEERQKTGSAMSQTSNSNGNKSSLSQNPPALDIPTIKTPGGHEDEDVKEHTTNRAPSEVSAKSNHSAKSSKSNKSLCKCSVKAAPPVVTSKPVEQDGSTTSIDKGSVKSGSTAASSAKARVRSKSPKNSATPSRESGTGECQNQASSTPTNEAKEEVDLTDNKAASVRTKSPCCLRPESAASRKKEIPVNSSSPCPVHNSRPSSKVDTSSESILSHSLSAADLLKDRIAAGRPNSQQSKASKSKSEKSGKSQRNKKEKVQLTPFCLPNASPNEVVSDWLRSIPTNSSMLAFSDELNEEEKKSGEDVGKEDEKPELEKDKEEEEDEGEKEKSDECDAMEEEESSEAPPANATGSSVQPNTLQGGETLPRSWHSSAAVMKVLLGSSMGRCRSMPEVSPVYGRRLSTSAKGLLDCLSQLQLIEPTVSSGYDAHKNQQQQYSDIMAILQSLWLAEPRNIQTKDVGTDQVSPPRSSSGVGMSSGSGGSGKENENRGGEETPPKQADSSHEDEEAGKVLKEGGTVGEAVQNMEEAKTDTPEEQQSSVPPSLDSPKATENPSSSDKSSANDSSKSPSDNEHETPEDSSSDTPPTVLRAPLTKRISQDPDPVWVMQLLKKLEKQFMNHYTNAMAEFKVRWDLDDSLILNTMISELRDEVNRRIQASIQREMKKIQSRAGKGGRTPRPPQGANLSRDSTMTEKRRRLLKVMKNQSAKTADSFSDEDMTGEFSDQRSDDEYCPCDACVRKKMAARPLKKPEVEAPIMMEFDLLKILQLKKMPCTPALSQPTEEEGESTPVEEEEVRSLGVVQEEEEEEETKEDIKPDIVLEEPIPEEDEEKEEEEKAKVQEGGEAVEENDEEEEGEEEVECQCQCARNEDSDKADEEEEAEESSSNTGDDDERGGEEEGANAEDEGDTGEDETGDDDGETGTGEEDESDKDTAKETRGNEGETSENEEGDDDEKEEEEEKSEEETTKKESGEEEEEEAKEASGETKMAANEESAAVGGNVSASAEAEDEDEGDGDDDTTEGESHEEEKGGEASGEERASPQDLEDTPATEGEEGDAEDSDTDRLPSNTSADESGHEGGGTTGNEGDKEGGADGDDEDEVVKDAVKELKTDTDRKENGALLHQFTKTSVESQPGSLEDVDADSPPNPVDTIEVPKMASTGGAGQRRSRSPGRVQRRKPKESDVKLDHSDM